MNIYKISAISLVITGCFSFTAIAQEKWSLSRCIDYAIQNNIQVKQRQFEKESSEIRLHTARMSRLPDLSGSAGQDFYFGRSPSRTGVYEDQSQSSTTFHISSSVPVFTGFRIQSEIGAARFDLKAAIEELNKAKEDIALNVTSYYLQALFNKEILQISQKQLEISRQQLQRTEKMVEQGKSPESSLYESRALVAEDEMNVTQSENNLLLSLVDLSQLLNLESAKDFDIEEPDIESITLQQEATLVSPTDAFAFSVENRPSIKSALYALESSRYGLKQARSGYFPTLSFGASYGTSFYHAYKGGNENSWTFAEQMRNNGSEILGFTLSVPLFNRFATRNQVKLARIQIGMQELALDNARQQLYKEIEQAYYAAVAAHKKFISSQKSVDAARISFEYEQKKYDAGKSTIFEYNDAKNKYEKSLSEQVQARYDFLFRSKVLDFYHGKPLVF